MGRTIQPHEVRKGDKLEIRRVVTAATDLDSDGDFKDENGAWVELSQYDFGEDGDDELILLERPNPPLPKVRGSLVKVSSRYGSTRWFLRQDGCWYSDEASSRSPEEFQGLIDRNQFTVEVIA